MPGRLRTYSFINAKLRTRIGMLLDDAFFKNALRSGSLEGALGALRNTQYADVAEIYDRTGDLKMCERALAEREVGILAEIERYVEDEVEDIVQALALRYETDTVKQAVRLWFHRTHREHGLSGVPHYMPRGDVIHPINVDAIAQADTLDTVAETLKGTPYADILRGTAEDVEKSLSIFPVEIALDRYYFRTLGAAVASLPPKDAEIARKLIGVEIDLQNIDMVIRLRHFYNVSAHEAAGLAIADGAHLRPGDIAAASAGDNPLSLLDEFVKQNYPGLSSLIGSSDRNDTSRLMLVRRLLDEIMRYEVNRTLAGAPFTVGIILSYFVLKRREIRRIVAVLNAAAYGLDESRISGL